MTSMHKYRFWAYMCPDIWLFFTLDSKVKSGTDDFICSFHFLLGSQSNQWLIYKRTVKLFQFWKVASGLAKQKVYNYRTKIQRSVKCDVTQYVGKEKETNIA